MIYTACITMKETVINISLLEVKEFRCHTFIVNFTLRILTYVYVQINIKWD